MALLPIRLFRFFEWLGDAREQIEAMASGNRWISRGNANNLNPDQAIKPEELLAQKEKAQARRERVAVTDWSWLAEAD